MRTRKGVSDINYLKLHGVLNGETLLYPFAPGKQNVALLSKISLNPINVVQDNSVYQELKIIPIKTGAIAYVETQDGNGSTTLTNKGFSYNYDNERGESKLVVELKENLINSGNYIENPIFVDFCRFKEDVYNGFDSQPLIDTGYVGDKNETTSDTIFGGDTYINLYSYKHTYGTQQQGRNGILITLLTESYDNIAYRKIGANPWETFHPANRLSPSEGNPNTIPETAILRWNTDGNAVLSGDVQIYYDNFFLYSDDFSRLNNIKPAFPKEKFNRTVEEFPTRIIRGNKDNTLNSFRVFKLEDFKDLPKNRGELTKLSAWNNRLVPHMQRGLFFTKGREQLATSDFEVFLGTGNIFEVEPNELLSTTNGFAGLQNPKSVIIIPQGYIFADNASKKIFMLSEGLKDMNIGLNEFIKENINNPIFGLDEDNKRLLVKLSNNHTLSYSLDFQSWTSFHDYHPTHFISLLNTFFSVKDNAIFKHNIGDFGRFYNTIFNTEYEWISNDSPNIEKSVRSVELDVSRIPESITITNGVQTSGVIPVDNTNSRKTASVWRINNFRDNSSNQWYEKRKLKDKWHKAKLIFSNSGNNSLYLYGAKLIEKIFTR
jgi:hypothetical protein